MDGVDDTHSDLSSGDSFGELSLLYNVPQLTDSAAETDCVLWRLDRDTFRKVLATKKIEHDKERLDLLKRVFLFKDLDDDTLTRISYAMTLATFKDGEQISKKGDDIKMFVIVKDGEMKATDIELGGCVYDDKTFGPGDSVGERVIMNNEPVPGNLFAVGDVELLWLSSEVFMKIFGDWSNLITRAMDRRILVRILFHLEHLRCGVLVS